MSAVFAQSFAKHAPRDAVSVSPASFAIERERMERDLTPDDLMEQMTIAEDGFFAAFRTGNEQLIGRVVKEVMKAALDRWTQAKLEVEGKTFDADEMARIVLMQYELEALTNRRGV